MPDRNDVLKCPLCHGHGQISRSEMVKKLSDPQAISAYIADLRKVAPEVIERRCTPEMVKPGGKRKSDFEREVHTWNPASDLWTRSNKE